MQLNLEEAARVVQLALTPVFLLSGVAALLNVFATRLGRVSDMTDAAALAAAKGGPDADRDLRLRVLRFRSRVLDVAVVFAAVAGALTCAAALVLFLGALLGKSAALTLFVLFGVAIIFTTGALIAFVVEMLVAARGVRRTVERTLGPRASAPVAPPPGIRR